MVNPFYGYGLQGKQKSSGQPKGANSEECANDEKHRMRVFLTGPGVQIEIVLGMFAHGYGPFGVTGYSASNVTQWVCPVNPYD